MFTRPLFYFSPDGDGGEAFSAPAGFSMKDVPAYSEATTAAPPPAEAKVETPEVKAEADAPVVQLGEEPKKNPAEVAKENAEAPPPDADKTTGPDEEPRTGLADVPQPQQSSALSEDLQIALDAYGITETDPVKAREALQAARADVVAKREQEAAQRETQRAAKAQEKIVDRATRETHDEIMAQLKANGWELDRTPPAGKQLWDAEAWADYEDPAGTAAELVAQYRALERADTTKAFYNERLSGAKGEYEATQAKINEATTRYAMHDPNVAAMMLDNNVPADIFETVARFTHEHTQKAIATTHSANVALTQENDSLKAQISGHDAAIAKAREEARAEGLKAALEELEAGRLLPGTVGLGGTSPQPFGVKGTFARPKGWSMDDARELIGNNGFGKR